MSDVLHLTLEIPSESDFACPAAGLAKALAERTGVGRRESYRFQLTVEEICLYLADLAEDKLRIELTGKRHQLDAAFAFKAANLSLGALNITSRASAGFADEPTDDVGLLLAGKAADRFLLKHQNGDQFLLEAEVDKTYPEATAGRPPEHLQPPYRIRTDAEPAQLAQAATLATAAYPAWECPPCYRTPEKFTDLLADGQVACVLAVDAKGQAVGLLSWQPSNEHALYFSGPFVFAPREVAPDVARVLIDGFLATVAREHFSIVLSFRATADLPQASFEGLGAIQSFTEGRPERHPVVFRQLREDNGLAVWCSPGLEPFLRQAYDRLALPRDILSVEAPTGRARRESLLGTDLDRMHSFASLQPLLDGEDMAANLRAHVEALRHKGIGTILYFMDLAVPWKAALAQDLIQAGFTPMALIPQGGQADKVLWQHEQSA